MMAKNFSACIFAIGTLWVALVAASCTTIAPDNGGGPAAERALLLSIKNKAGALHHKVAGFWLANGPDKINGGFYGYHDISGNPDPKADKGLVCESRHLYYMSRYYKEVEHNPQVKANADSLYRFLTTSKLRDVASGAFVFRVDATGRKITEGHRQLQSNSFAIYALANYAMVFDNAPAREMALKAFQSIARESWDATYGGFNQENDPWYFPQPSGDSRVMKEANGQLQMMQAAGALYLATRDPAVREKLVALINIFNDRIIADRSYVHTRFGRDWTPIAEDPVKFGQEFSSVWFLLTAAAAADLPRSDPAAYARVVATVKRIGAAADAHGFDTRYGGFYETTTPAGAVLSDRKVWWIQTEALNGLWQLYRLSGDAKYLQHIDRTLDFVSRYLVTPTGEWRWQALADGGQDATNNFIGGEWKTSYHTGRALLQLEQWTGELLR